LGDPQAAEALARVFERNPDFRVEEELQRWNAAPDDMAHLLDALHKAGLKE
jgi:hypothetical protein